MSQRRQLFDTGFWLLRRSRLGHVLAPFTQGCGLIFTLHRVRPASQDPFQPNRHLEITPEFLAQVIERVRSRGYKFVSMEEAVDRLKLCFGQERYAVLSFDDGYRDNLTVAYPLLRQMGVPFTLFLTSGFLDRTSELWWIALERMIAAQDVLHFAARGEASLIPCATLEEKQACYAALVQLLTEDLDETGQRAMVRELCALNGFDLEALADEEMLSWNEARSLARDPLVSIGAHTHDHHALARLPEAGAEADIRRGIERIEDELGRRPAFIAYPYGGAETAGLREAALAAGAGLRAGVTTVPGVLKSIHARQAMLLPRVSLNGHFQGPEVIDEYLTGAPFALYRAFRRVSRAFSRRAPSTR
ncbi:polysaccharide deacetylase family protein [Pannonibacter indicus]|uniref:polysaccharide deacetylase family protein n=1 Tax=Pannonibacter indicus TaxID=466044 RepID=UPI0035B4B7F5